MNASGQQRYGSLIGLKAEFEERYIILHQHTFPGVLKRIRDSHVRNYSIFLAEGILFSFFEYQGDDYQADMQAMAADPTTRDWWKLTDPMQIPLETRTQGERWQTLPELLHVDNDVGLPVDSRMRCAYAAAGDLRNAPKPLPEAISGAARLSLFSSADFGYLYLEYAPPHDFPPNLSFWNLDWGAMREVFHTD